MARALGIGGVLFKSPDPKALGKWYRDVLGVPFEDGCGRFGWFLDPDGNKVELWQPIVVDTDEANGS